MESLSSAELVEHLWANVERESFTCCSCGDKIAQDDVLIRTFTLQSLRESEDGYAQKIEVPALSETIIIYHRHMECLFRFGDYIAVSHVWDPMVASCQLGRSSSAASVNAEALTKEICETPARICLGLASSLQFGFEIWHDYISVPQWDTAVKRKIIYSIPKLYANAKFTLVHLHDVDESDMDAMRNGGTEARCRGISNICNARYFGRVWTAMELTQSHQIQLMLRNFTLAKSGDNMPFLQELRGAWEDEIGQRGNPQELEQLVGMGYNLVPWQLGPLEIVRRQNSTGIRNTFALAHDLLARRCVSISRDFFHAFLGVLGRGLLESKLSADEGLALLEVARACLSDGDLSPLLMVPEDVQEQSDPRHLQSTGYLDLVTFGMEDELSRPTFGEVKFNHGNPIIWAEDLGTINRPAVQESTVYGHGRIMEAFSSLVRLAVEHCGTDVDAFVNTIGSRMYAQSPDQILSLLSEENSRTQLQDRLKALSDTQTASGEHNEEIFAWIADAMGLSNHKLSCDMSPLTPLNFLEAHGGSVHLAGCSGAVTVVCSSCEKEFLIRAALYCHPQDVVGTRAYRIPGLQFRYTHRGGCGLLLKE